MTKPYFTVAVIAHQTEPYLPQALGSVFVQTFPGELLRQYGFQTLFIMLFDENGISPHTFLEARKNGIFYLLDPFCGKISEGTSFRKMQSDKRIMEDFWPDNKRFQNAVANAKYIHPATPQEYCQRNILLSSFLRRNRSQSQDAFFHHLQDPVKEMSDYIKENRIPTQNCSFWTYPFTLLADDISGEKTYKLPHLRFEL